MSYHPGRQALERFARGDVLRHEAREIVAHLRSGCQTCQREIDRLLPVVDAGTTAPPVQPFKFPFEDELAKSWPGLDLRFLKGQLMRFERERELAGQGAAELLALSSPERRDAVRSDPRLWTPAVCDRVIDASFRACFDAPSRAVELAELALELVERVDEGVYGRAVLADLKGRAWSFLGNARRVGSDRRGAEEAFDVAQSILEGGSADPLEQARLLDFRASLAADRGRFEEAIELLDVVLEIYEEIHEPQRKGRALLSKGSVRGLQGDADAAAGLIHESLSLLDFESEPRLLLYAHHNYAWFVEEAGRHEEARAHLERIAPLYDELADAAARIRRLWLSGRIAAGLDRYAEAETALREVQRRFIEQGLAYDAAVVTMDLAALYLRLGRTREVAELAVETFPILVAEDVHHHALAAIVAFTHAVELDCATPKLARQVAGYLQRAKRNPSLPFESAV